MTELIKSNSKVVKISDSDGVQVIPQGTPLTRLNYFDGKYLRAPDLQQEQKALLAHVYLSNLAGGPGIVHGFDCVRATGDKLTVTAGLAYDAQGRPLYLTQEVTLAVADLIALSKSNTKSASSIKKTKVSSAKEFGDCSLDTAGSSPTDTAPETDEMYVITLNYVEAYCGQEDVFGQLCADACNTRSERPYIVEGVEIRAIPLKLGVALKTTSAVTLGRQHLRSRVAAAYFEQESRSPASLISGDGLRSSLWCAGAEAVAGNGVAVALISRAGGTTEFLDPWIVRRERMVSPPRHYWAARMAMRSWHIFLAQILQFQCQLRTAVASGVSIDNGGDPCAGKNELLAEAAEGLNKLMRYYESVASRFTSTVRLADDIEFSKMALMKDGIASIKTTHSKLLDVAKLKTSTPNRMLINAGILELPSAGYLPVQSSDTLTINEQVQRMMGEGVDLRFCVVRPDFVPHALEEAQHMERICLVQGLADPAAKPHVDILVPNGRFEDVVQVATGTGFETSVSLQTLIFLLGWPKKAAATTEKNEAVLQTNFDSKSFLKAARTKYQSASYQNTSSQGTSKNTANTESILSTSTTRTSANTASTSTRSSTTELPAMSGAGRGATLDTGGSAFYFAGQADSDATLASPRFSIDIPVEAMWVQLQCDKPASALTSGVTANVLADVIVKIAIESGDKLVTQRHQRKITATLRVDSNTASGASRQIKARLTGTGLWKAEVTSSSETETRTESITLDESVYITTNPVSGMPDSISVVIVNPTLFAGLSNVSLQFDCVYTAPDKATFEASVRVTQAEEYYRSAAKLESSAATLASANESSQIITLFSGNLKVSQSVLNAGNRWHDASIAAFTQVAGSGFNADEAGRLLFPAPQPIEQRLRVFGREDWVLFHRRREKECGAGIPQEAAAKTRLYRVYEVPLRSSISMERLIAALEKDSNGVIAELKPTAVSKVEFAAGIASLVTSADDIRNDWSTAQESETNLQLALIASQGDALQEGETLAASRLQTLTQVISSVSTPASDMQSMTIGMPPTLTAGDVDGVILYFVREAATVTHAVYRLVTTEYGMFQERLHNYLLQNPQSPVSTFLGKEAKLLAKQPRFAGDSDDYFSANDAAELDAAWDLQGDGPVSHAFVMAEAGKDENSDKVDLSTCQQAAKIVSSVGSVIAADDVNSHVVSTQNLNGSQAITVLVAEVEINDVYLMTPTVRSGNEMPEQALKYIAEAGLPADLAEQVKGSDAKGVWTHVEVMAFHKGTDDTEAESQAKFQQTWTNLVGNTSLGQLDGYIIGVAQSSSDATVKKALLDVATEQASVLRGLMGINQMAVSGLNAGGTEFPTGMRAVTIVLIPKISPEEKLVNLKEEKADTTTSPPNEKEKVIEEAFKEGIRYDDQTNVVLDGALEKAIAQLKTEDTKVNSIEVVTLNAADTDDTAAKKLLETLKSEGVAATGATVTVRVATAAERTQMLKGGLSSNKALRIK